MSFTGGYMQNQNKNVDKRLLISLNISGDYIQIVKEQLSGHRDIDKK